MDKGRVLGKAMDGLEVKERTEFPAELRHTRH
jgi:hypothetical protein